MPKPKELEQSLYSGQNPRNEGAVVAYTDTGTGTPVKIKTGPTNLGDDLPGGDDDGNPGSGHGGGGASSGGSGIAVPGGPVEANPYRTGADEARALYERARAALDQAGTGKPTWNGSSFDDDIADLYAQISGRGSFSYDLNKDALWQQYKDEYRQAAKAAMTDTMGRAAALTGGYGSSYGQAVGQQAYDRRMEELMEIAPELYERAYGRWQDEGDRMTQQLGLARTLAGDEYDRFGDDFDRWYTERQLAADAEKTAYSRMLDERDYADSKEGEAYQKITSLIALGYTPTAQELADAGITVDQYAAIAAQYAPKSGGGGGKKDEEEEDLSDEALMEELRRAMRDEALSRKGRLV